MIQLLNFKPLPGLASPHLQMIISNFSSPGLEPPSKQYLVPLPDGDQLSCEISTPHTWQPHHKTIVMIHGLGGSHRSGYQIRLARKFYQKGLRTVRINLRGCGSGIHLNKLPYNSGNSADIIAVLKSLKNQTPLSPITLLGFSLGGNISIKMAAELGTEAQRYLEKVITICSPLDLGESIRLIQKKRHWIYQRYYLKSILQQGKKWAINKKIRSIYDYDQKVTAPLWGYKDANDYYSKCSSRHFLPAVKIPCDILLTADDPFVNYQTINQISIPNTAKVWLTKRGSHMGFLGRGNQAPDMFWMDNLLLSWTI